MSFLRSDSCLLLLLCLLHAVSSSPHVLKRDSDPVLGGDSRAPAKKNVTSAAEIPAKREKRYTTPPLLRYDGGQVKINTSSAIKIQNLIRLQPTLSTEMITPTIENPLEPELLSFTKVEDANDYSAQKSSDSRGTIGLPKAGKGQRQNTSKDSNSSLRQVSEAIAPLNESTGLNYKAIRNNQTNQSMASNVLSSNLNLKQFQRSNTLTSQIIVQNPISTVANRQSVLNRYINASTSSTADKSDVHFPMLADDAFTTPILPQNVTVPSIFPKQLKKPIVAVAKSANTTLLKVKTTPRNSPANKVSTTPKYKTDSKPNNKKPFYNSNSVPNVGVSKTPHIVAASSPTPPALIIPFAVYNNSELLSCGGTIPIFKSIITNGTYDVRDYPASAWLSTSVITNNRILAELEARNKLQRYFNGDNEKGSRFVRTCPVLTQIKFKGTFSESRERVDEYAVSFYLPWNGKSDIASPNDSEVLVDIVEERTIYVHPFEARVWEMTDSYLQSEARKLTAELRKRGEAFLSKYFYVASYARSPTSDEFAKYEIWVYATRFRPHDVIAVRQPLMDQPLSEITRRTRSRVCKGFECPSFDVLAAYKVGIQKRRYYGARFATYLPEFCSFTKAAIWRAFMPLHLYKHGVNSHFEVIGATRPAGIVHVKENSTNTASNGSSSSCTQSFTVSLYLPKRLHAAPPVAGSTAPRIKITELDDVIVYVQSVGGFLLEPNRIQKEVGLFRLRLREQNLCYKTNEYYLVVYDYITRFHGRLNEIWVVADRCPDSL